MLFIICVLIIPEELISLAALTSLNPKSLKTVLLCVPILFLCLALLPLTLMPKIIVTMAILVPVGGFALIGIGGDSLTRWLKAWINWRKHRRMIFYRGEVRL